MLPVLVGASHDPVVESASFAGQGPHLGGGVDSAGEGREGSGALLDAAADVSAQCGGGVGACESFGGGSGGLVHRQEA